ncbi:LysM peptidoglycan-binding domain-containing protein [Clostridium oryzae]|uniref:Spore germination protein YaaH n=1 Tax=Clostridium oryzae TaxID=1450648 RepID=A0A1V4IMT7_9CLOT|nr:glycoside hydrolase family 18 protein [Clostridium oryzae]OPJ61169.1 spore germination protein YaaH [Clostridium oryzae]
MKIHTVASGQSPWSIANTYGVPLNKLIAANGLDQIPHLVVGQSLVIPGVAAVHSVRRGESLYSIATRYGVTAESIAAANDLSVSETIYPGRTLIIPEKPKRYGTIQTNGFIIPSTTERENRIIDEAAPYLTYISPFSYQVNANAGLTPIRDENIIRRSKDYRTAPLLSVTNISASGGFDTRLIDRILTDDALQNTLINNILSTIQSKGYYGVIIDFERISPQNREAYNSFLRKVVARLNPRYLVATALAPKTYDIREGAWHGAHDYRAHGEIVNFVIIMTYEWGWSGGPPMAVAPISEVRKVLNYALSVIPAKKIMMGMPLYGYDWTLPYTPGGEFAKAIGFLEAVRIAANNGAAISYNTKYASPHFKYYDRARNEHEVWFEDARSLFQKYLLVNELGLRGVSYWSLGNPAPMNWYIVDSMFNIEKIV